MDNMALGSILIALYSVCKAILSNSKLEDNLGYIRH